MCFKWLNPYCTKPEKSDKIQSHQMKKAMKRNKYVTEAYLQGGKAIGDLIKKKIKKPKDERF